MLIEPVAETVIPTFSTQGRFVLKVEVRDRETPLELASALLSHINFVCHMYTKLRSHGRVIAVAEEDARASVADLLTLQYNRALFGTLPLRARLKPLWRTRGWRKNSTRFIAATWLGLVTIEENKREWSRTRLVFDESASSGNMNLLFQQEYPQEVNLVTSLDVSSIRASVEQMAARIDTRFTVFTTTVVALIGALIGAIASQLAG
ncbi:hypothetical protein [Micromonospora sp. WMMD975]|uniref:hypothetical protein n=1 Tax=Micromonospora sp. WMMD975 TaxID=3016087 RepID=UPI00249B36D1|nr:hypothetical protein [Micromonospora sp. WMMD975]WFE34552.1 hypothetical protein O7613_03975 [Micromonospora sp. WMMD975]